MAKIYLVSFADANMTISQKRLEETFLKVPNACGLEKRTMGFRETDIDDHFKFTNDDILTQPRGAGYWLWKPYVIMRALERVEKDDAIIYSDAGMDTIGDVSPLLNIEPDIALFSNRWKHLDFCKMDVVQAILGQSRYDHDAFQVQASTIIVKKTWFAKRFIKEWLTWCQMPGFIDDTPTNIANVDTYNEHRHDQAILCCLALKYGLTLHWWPSKYNEVHKHLYNDNYPSVFLQHRKRNDEW